MDFGSRLKELRLAKKYGVNQLALKSGVSSAQISRYENGKRKTPQIDTVKKLADALDVSVSELIGKCSDSESNERFSQKQLTVAAHIDEDTSEEDMKDILNFIDFIKNRDHEQQFISMSLGVVKCISMKL